jgi:hypothetical protein
MPSTHTRKQIRDASVTALTGLSTTGSDVYSGRARPLAKGHPSTLLVYAIDESVSIESMGRKQIRALTLRVEGRIQVGGSEDAEDDLDAIAAEVEIALLKSGAILSLARSIELTRTQIDIQAPGDSINGSIVMDFTVEYCTIEGAPTVAV